MTSIKIPALITGTLSLVTFCIMLGTLAVLSVVSDCYTVSNIYLACMLGSLLSGIGCLMGAYLDRDI